MRRLLALLALCLAVAPAAGASPEVWQALREGGHVALLRHPHCGCAWDVLAAG